MKITVSPYNPQWKMLFEQIRVELQTVLGDRAQAIEHIGSTSVENLSAKPIIDVGVGLKSAELFGEIVEKMRLLEDYIYYEAFNESMPQRRLFVKMKSPVSAYGLSSVFRTEAEIPHETVNENRLAHVHAWVFGSSDWTRHIAFRDYLRAHPQVKAEYEMLKMRLSEREWEHGMEYNQAKNSFIKKTETAALIWYNKL